MGHRSQVRGVLGSPLPTETTEEQPPSAGKRTWGTGFPLGFSGSRVSLPGLAGSTGFHGNLSGLPLNPLSLTLSHLSLTRFLSLSLLLSLWVARQMNEEEENEMGVQHGLCG
jgi:hypothetical protein